MLETLTIRGYALIDSANLDFSEHLTVLSGETGAGKSILIGALSLLLGGKGDTESIRIGSEEAEITAMVRVDSCDGALGWLADHDISDEDGAVLLRRVLKRNGRGSSFIQSTPATLKDLRDLTGFLFDLHGQHEHQSLFRWITIGCSLIVLPALKNVPARSLRFLPPLHPSIRSWRAFAAMNGIFFVNGISLSMQSMKLTRASSSPEKKRN